METQIYSIFETNRIYVMKNLNGMICEGLGALGKNGKKYRSRAKLSK